jgi:CRP/FNR family transcriptional regulator
MAQRNFDPQCYDRLYERFQYLFEESLIAEMCRYGELRRIPEDTLLMEIGQEITHMPLIVSGTIKVMTEDDKGDELLLYYLELGDTCAMTLNCCSSSAKSAVAAITEEPCEVLFIPVGKMEEWMVTYTSWRNFVLESYNSRLMEMLEAIDNLAFHNMEERLSKYLRDKAMVTHNGDLKTTHFQIASDLHSSRVVISRLMKKLEKEGVIRQHRNRVEVLEFKED